MPLLNLNVQVYIIVGYFCVISIIASLVTIFDKMVSMRKGKGKNSKNKRRVPESTLIFISCIGGCLSMLITMLIIRHKTQHRKFMIGLPIILIMQVIVVIYLLVTYAGFKFELPV